MLQSLGFGSVSTDVLWAVALCLVVLALLVGWVSDAVLGAVGFGLFGNTVWGLVGAVAGLYVVLRYGWEWVSPDVVSMSGASVAGAFSGVLAMAILRRLST